ncbi:MAG: TIGR01777 family oxidoreductase [Gemmatimonadales bacterium]
MSGAGLRVAITGATGLIGTALGESLRRRGHTVLAISRHPPIDVLWDPVRRRIDTHPIEGLDAVVHLAGENLAGGRWTASRKQRLRSSRVDVTRWLADTLAGLRRPPRVLVSASAVGIYGDRGDELLDDDSPPGDDFLARLAVDWETAADPARQAGIRVVHPRFGMVLARQGGALAKMVPPFRLGIGGRIGNGRQWITWVAIDDVVAATEHLIVSDDLAGPVIVAAPAPVRNADFVAALGRALHRPTVLPVPAFALLAVYGEMARATLLASQRAVPVRLTAHGFTPRFGSIDATLRDLLAPVHG